MLCTVIYKSVSCRKIQTKQPGFFVLPVLAPFPIHSTVLNALKKMATDCRTCVKYDIIEDHALGRKRSISGSQNLTVSRDRLLCDRDQALQAWLAPTIRTYLWPRYHTNNYSVVPLNSCELYLAL